MKQQNSGQVRRKTRRRIRQERRLLFLFSTSMTLALICSFLMGRASAEWDVFFNSNRVFHEKNQTDDVIKTPAAVLDGGLSQAAATPESEWNLILVNHKNPLPADFVVPELTKLKNGHAIDSRVYLSLQSMMDDARAAGLDPLICSSFRTWEKQEELYQNKVESLLTQGVSEKEAKEQAGRWVAYPGTSEHQAGLAVDIVDTSYQRLDEKQENTNVQKWLMKHCAEYGFILRYPTDKSEITGIGYEPWHYRYVGKEVASIIMEQGICLEEYLLQE